MAEQGADLEVTGKVIDVNQNKRALLMSEGDPGKIMSRNNKDELQPK